MSLVTPALFFGGHAPGISVGLDLCSNQASMKSRVCQRSGKWWLSSRCCLRPECCHKPRANSLLCVLTPKYELGVGVNSTHEDAVCIIRGSRYSCCCSTHAMTTSTAACANARHTTSWSVSGLSLHVMTLNPSLQRKPKSFSRVYTHRRNMLRTFWTLTPTSSGEDARRSLAISLNLVRISLINDTSKAPVTLVDLGFFWMCMGGSRMVVSSLKTHQSTDEIRGAFALSLSCNCLRVAPDARQASALTTTAFLRPWQFSDMRDQVPRSTRQVGGLPFSVSPRRKREPINYWR